MLGFARSRWQILLLALTALAWLGLGERNPVAAADGTPARLAFQRLMALAGTWEARSTEGWEGTSEVQVIAKDSAILSVSTFSAHPGETMATVFTLDGDRLLLTHYCVARNQPRLVASDISADGRRIRFTFLDGGNLPTRDRGHMDSVSIELVDDDHYRSQWTWYQDGKEGFLEKIENQRTARH